ncbi:MAG: putative baseplate assembly protein, partial [Anaerolineae bacterium]|nr:putative baseplate assembly protein [Anaerolineae bacterium]
LSELEAQLNALSSEYGFPLELDKKEPNLKRALAEAFLRFAEIVIDRINRVPDKNFLAFLDMLGLDLLPPRAARVPLTFTLASGTAAGAKVPAGTLVTAAPAAGETEPIVFETEEDLILTGCSLVAVCTADSKQSIYFNDYSLRGTGKEAQDFPVFQGSDFAVKYIYLGCRYLDIKAARTVTLNCPTNIPCDCFEGSKWEYWNGEEYKSLKTRPTSVSDSLNLTVEEILIPTTIAGTESSWLRVELNATVSDTDLPKINAVDSTVDVLIEAKANAVPDLIFANQTLIDSTENFYPFGERPRTGDTLYLSSRDFFSKEGAKITIKVTLSRRGKPSKDLKLPWDYWDAERQNWMLLPLEPQNGEYMFDTKSDQILTFKCPKVGETEINSKRGYWIRVRITGGDYGHQEYLSPIFKKVGDEFKPAIGADGKPILKPVSDVAPPLIKSIHLGLEPTKVPVDILVESENNGFKVYRSGDSDIDALYLGFKPSAPNAGFGDQPTTLYFGVEGSAEPSDPQDLPVLNWKYWNGAGWRDLDVQDETQGFTRRGLVTIVGPQDFTRSTWFGREAFWLCIQRPVGTYKNPPRLRRILTNTTWATNTQTIRNETLGSSNGEPDQVFRTTRKPVMTRQCLEVGEPEMPSTADIEAIMAEERADLQEDVVKAVRDNTGRLVEAWVRWHGVTDFYASTPHSRHYVVDRRTGEVRFGDGKHGRIPPRGRNNVRFARYQVSSGAKGNRPAGSITQLKIAVPYVQSVTNWEAAEGGADQESVEAVKIRGPKTLRHGDRAVTASDFEDLAFEASPFVARAKCPETTTPGNVELAILSKSNGGTPSAELCTEIKQYIEARMAPAVTLEIKPPSFVCVAVTATVALTDPKNESEVKRAICARLDAFLDPLSGGPDGQGWDFWHKPSKSDLYALIHSIQGVDYVTSLGELPEVESGEVICSSAEHEITVKDPKEAEDANTGP